MKTVDGILKLFPAKGKAAMEKLVKQIQMVHVPDEDLVMVSYKAI